MKAGVRKPKNDKWGWIRHTVKSEEEAKLEKPEKILAEEGKIWWEVSGDTGQREFRYMATHMYLHI